MSAVTTAVDHFRQGCACSQAVLAAFGPRFGLDEASCLRVASGFGAGMRLGETCGAVSGALMALGLAHCQENCGALEHREAAYGAIASFLEQFRARHGTLVCRNLLGCDIHTPEGLLAAHDQGLFETRCVDLVRSAATLVEALLPAATSPRCARTDRD